MAGLFTAGIICLTFTKPATSATWKSVKSNSRCAGIWLKTNSIRCKKACSNPVRRNICSILKMICGKPETLEEKEFQPVLEKMRNQLKEEVLQSRDVMFLPEYEIGLLSEYTTAYEFRLNEENYPLEEIYEAASLSGFRGKRSRKNKSDLLSNDNPVVRYWAILGLRSQNPETLQPFSQKILECHG
jgi:hypothetical protein